MLMQDDEYEVVLGSDDKNVYFYLTNCYQIRCKKIYSKKWQNQMWQISKRLKKDRCFALGYLQIRSLFLLVFSRPSIKRVLIQFFVIYITFFPFCALTIFLDIALRLLVLYQIS